MQQKKSFAESVVMGVYQQQNIPDKQTKFKHFGWNIDNLSAKKLDAIDKNDARFMNFGDQASVASVEDEDC